MSARRFAIRSSLAALAAFAGLAARAQDPGIVKAQSGEWLVASDDGRPGCRIRLRVDTTIGGHVANPSTECAARIPALAALAAWRLSDGVTLSDATRQPIFVFQEDETAILKTRHGGPPAYYMVRAKAGIDRVPHASAVFGAWQMRRPKGPAICNVTLRDQPPKGGEESYALAVDPACDAAIRRLKLASWRIEDVRLVLYGSDGESLAFEPSATGFDKVARKGDRPLELVRRP